MGVGEWGRDGGDGDGDGGSVNDSERMDKAGPLHFAPVAAHCEKSLFFTPF